MTELKRRQNTCDHQTLTSDVPKRKKADMSASMSSKLSAKLFRRIVIVSTANQVTEKHIRISNHLRPLETKEKISERIVALQQLVSPFGKTDTASVLLEAMEYISFLHDQVKVLSAPYLHSSPVNKTQGAEQYSLRSRGLCLVPTSTTAGIAGSNGADIWAPIKSSPSGF